MGHQKNQANQTAEDKKAQQQPQLEPVGFYKYTEDGLKSLILIEKVNSSRKSWYVFSLYTGVEGKHQFRYITTIGVYKESDEVKGGFKGLSERMAKAHKKVAKILINLTQEAPASIEVPEAPEVPDNLTIAYEEAYRDLTREETLLPDGLIDHIKNQHQISN